MPVPSLTSVNASVADDVVNPLTARSVTGTCGRASALSLRHDLIRLNPGLRKGEMTEKFSGKEETLGACRDIDFLLPPPDRESESRLPAAVVALAAFAGRTQTASAKPTVNVRTGSAEACAISHNSDARTAAAVLSKRGTTVVVKQGAQGALLGRNGDVIAHEGYPVQPLDTTGAGDAFNAGFLKGWLSGASPEECLRLGNAVGALSTQGLGAVDSQPDITAVTDFLKERS